MTAVNRSWVLKTVPAELPVLGPEGTFELKEAHVSLDSTKMESGSVLVKVSCISVDPAMRTWMGPAASYIKAEIGQVFPAFGVGTIVASTNPDWQSGQQVVGQLGFQEYVLVKAASAAQLQKVPQYVLSISPTAILGGLGFTSLTAYFGLLEIGQPKAGETVVISAAAGATGSVAGQIAKLRGCRVVGIAGSPEKCAWLTGGLGFDAAVNYREGSLGSQLRRACPKGVDVYFDNVGGSTLDAVLSRINRGARIVACGSISQYNQQSAEGIRNYSMLTVKSARMEGFLVFKYADKYEEARQQLAEWVRAGKIKYKEQVVEGFEKLPEALVMLFQGANTGKLLVKLNTELRSKY